MNNLFFSLSSVEASFIFFIISFALAFSPSSIFKLSSLFLITSFNLFLLFSSSNTLLFIVLFKQSTDIIFLGISFSNSSNEALFACNFAYISLSLSFKELINSSFLFKASSIFNRSLSITSFLFILFSISFISLFKTSILLFKLIPIFLTSSFEETSYSGLILISLESLLNDLLQFSNKLLASELILVNSSIILLFSS